MKMASDNTFMKFQFMVKILCEDRDPLEELREEIKSILNRYKSKYKGRLKSGNLSVRRK